MSESPEVAEALISIVTATSIDSDKEILITYRNAVGILLADTLSFGLALLEGVLVLELGAHSGGVAYRDAGWLVRSWASGGDRRAT